MASERNVATPEELAEQFGIEDLADLTGDANSLYEDYLDFADTWED